MTATAQLRPDVGTLLRTWRERRRLSQLELSSRARVSTRHLSYVETGRSRPTPELVEPPLNAIRLSLHPGGLAPRIRNLQQWAAHLVHQVRSRAEVTHDPVLADLADEAASYVDLDPRTPAPAGPVLALELDSPDGVLRFFSVSARLETATGATLDELHLETFLPADEATQAALRPQEDGADRGRRGSRA